MTTLDALRRLTEVCPPKFDRVEGPLVPSAERQLFARLLAEWREILDKNSTSSDIQSLFLSPPYQGIIGMGKTAVPFILEQLREKPGHWFWALKAITQADPVPLEHRGNLNKMTADWLGWAARQGL